MALSKESADALRECVRILAAKYRDPKQRATMARNVEQCMGEGKLLPAFMTADLGVLYYLDEPHLAAEVQAAFDAAAASGELSDAGGTATQAWPSDLAAWLACPRVPLRSPLRSFASWVHA